MAVVSFDQAVKYYDSTRGYPAGVPEQIRDAIIHYTQAHAAMRFIELGIGPGIIGEPFLKLSYSYVGVDISSLMMAQMHQKLSQPVKPLQLAQADITQSLPFSNQSFDVVMAIRVFHVLDHWQSAIAEAKRVLRPEGALLIARDANRDPSSPANPMTMIHSKWDEILAGLDIAPGTIRPGLWLSDETIATHLRNEGATIQPVDLVTYSSPAISMRQMAERHKQRMYSRDWELPDHIHTEAVKLLETWLANDCAEPDTEVTQQMTFRAIIARW